MTKKIEQTKKIIRANATKANKARTSTKATLPIKPVTIKATKKQPPKAKSSQIPSLPSSQSFTPIKFQDPMLASNFDGNQIVDNWYMSEKLDGVRAIWNGKNLYSRAGNIFSPPDFFIEKFPKNLMLDGELFLDRFKFSETISIVKKKQAHDGWGKIKYLVFDGPEIKGDFNKRLKVLEESLGTINSPFIKLHKHEIASNISIIESKMNEITKINGEGLILRDPKSFYENRRSKQMLKVKRFHDAEAIVQTHIRGEGRLSGMTGAIQVINKDGVTFKIGSGFTDAERRKPPKIGSVVTYRYFELSKDGVPRFPTFMRIHPGM